MVFFQVAVPVWLHGLQQEMNCTCGFYTSLMFREGEEFRLSIATAGFYRLYINGEFIHYGPVRSAHGFYRVDELELTPFLSVGINHVAIEVVHYNVNSFYCLYQPPFLQAEIIEYQSRSVIAATSLDKGFQAFQLHERIQKVQRYSFQRGMGECYRLNENCYAWRTGDFEDRQTAVVVQVRDKNLIERRIPCHTFPIVFPQNVLSRGIVKTGCKPLKYRKDRSLTQINDKLRGYREEELTVYISDDVQELTYLEKARVNLPYEGKTSLDSNTFEILCFPSEKTGFLCLEIESRQEGMLYLMMDEILTGDDVDPLRMECLNAIPISMAQGRYQFQTFEPYGFRYLKTVCVSGEFIIRNIHVKELVNPLPLISDYTGCDETLAKVYAAAKETFRQNTSDLFMDCPTRERGGWLCDSFFIARAEKEFTGENRMERIFLENFLLPDAFDNIPDGMLPMCYPADHFDGVYIPNWAMWFVIQLKDYQDRTGDTEFVKKFRVRVYKLLDYFCPFENEYGLLEGLPGWIFVEWSKANELVQDINYPSNMLYSEMLYCAGKLFGDECLVDKSQQIAQTIRERSFDGTFFVDNEIRQNGALLSTGERTETCQYYAFFFRIATPETHPELWHRLVHDFGPHRHENGAFPDIYPSNAFIGNYLRLDILCRYGLYSQTLEEITDGFLHMVDKTGTLWENINDHASCNHGFASYVACLIHRATDIEKQNGDSL